MPLRCHSAASPRGFSNPRAGGGCCCRSPAPHPEPPPLPQFLRAPRGTAGQRGASGSMSGCQGQLVAAAHALPHPPVLLTDKEGRQLPPDEALDEAVPEYRAPGRKSLQELQQLDPEDESLAKYKQALLGPLPPVVGTHGLGLWGGARAGGTVVTSGVSSDESLPNVQVTRLTLMSEQAPGPITMDLTGTSRGSRAGGGWPGTPRRPGLNCTFPGRGAGCAPRPGVCPEGGSGLQSEDHLQGEARSRGTGGSSAAPGGAPNHLCPSGQQGDRQWPQVCAPHLPPGPAR